MELSVKQNVAAFYKGTDALTRFSFDVMIPVLTGQLNLSDRENAIVESYYRMHCYMQSLVTMNSPVHYQAAASTTRSLFELLMDVKLLVDDKDGSQVARFHAFIQVERHRVAKRIVKFKDQYPDSKLDDEHQRKLVEADGKKDEVEGLIIKYWGTDKHGKPKRPEHWSGMKILERSHSLGATYEELYVESYPVLSWFVHAGAAGHSGLDASVFESLFGLSHALAQRLFLEAIVIVAAEMHIDKAFDGLNGVLEELRLTPGRAILEEQTRRIDEAREQARSNLGGLGS